MIIRDETHQDYPAIDRLITEAFLTAPHSSGDEAGIVSRLRADGDLTCALVAELDGALVGHVAVSKGRIGAESNWRCIGPIAVLPAHQGQGFGAALMQEVLARARADQADGVALVGDPAWYQRFGFAPAPGVTVPGIPPDYVLLLPFGPAPPSGVLHYAAAFGLDAS